MNNKVVAWILKAPLLLVMLAAFVGGIYAAAMNIQVVTYATPVILGVLIALYAWVEVLASKD